MNPVDILTSGKITKDDIGKTVYLSNSASSCQEWLIADIDHDSTTGTVDLISKYTFITAMVYGTDDLHTPVRYSSCSPYNKMLSYLSYFSKDVASNLLDFSVEANGYYHVSSLVESSTETSKIHMPSITELGYGAGNMLDASYNLICCVEEGSAYPIFDRGSTSNGNSLCKRTTSDGEHRSYWTRSCASYRYDKYAILDRDGEYYIDEDGKYNISTDFYNADSFWAIAIIRFTSK